MGLSNKGPITPYHGSWADKEFKRRRAEIMAGSPNRVDDFIAMAKLRSCPRFLIRLTSRCFLPG
jgi:hypothetical protein